MPNKEPMVSIIVPVYNAERFLHDTITSVINQTYTSWELILIDDCSQDKSVEVIKNYKQDDDRIKLLRMETNSGVAMARNMGIDVACGRYIAFLDADDTYLSTKLEKQIKFMQSKNCAFSFTAYEFADKDLRPNGIVARVPDTITRRFMLKNHIAWTCTIMLDMTKLTKEDVYLCNLPYGEDYATWLKILRKTKIGYGLDEILSYYRRSASTLSSNKISALINTWNLYRNHEKLSIVKTFYYISLYSINATRKRI